MSRGVLFTREAFGVDKLVTGEPAPSEVAHQRIGPVAVANSAADWAAYAQCAIDEAARAVEELTRS